MSRRVEDGIDGSRFNNPTAIHYSDTVACFGNHTEVVGDENDRHVSPVSETAE
jgi:hypothetical protein